MATHLNGADDFTAFRDAAWSSSLTPDGLLSDPAGPIVQSVLDGLQQIDSRARFLVDRTGRILAESPATRKILGCVDSISIMKAALVASDADTREELAKMFALRPKKLMTIMRQCSREEGHCIVRAVGLCEHTVLVSAQCAHQDGETEIADLCEAFRLTPSEAHVVELLIAGHSPAGIAPKLGVSVNTVRAHLRHCYEKMNVSSREELWRAVSPYRLN